MIRYLNLILFTGMILMNYLANALPLNNKTTGQISGSYPNLFVPAGITFSIWGVIYLLLAGFCVAQFFPRFKGSAESIGWLFAASCVLNGLWIVAWHYERLPLSLLIMTGLLAVLILINFKVRDIPPGLTKAAFGIYLGWICIAAIANLTALLVSINFDGAGISEEIWTIIMIAAGVCIISLATIKFSNPFIGLAAMWAFAGIIIKRHADYRIIAFCALAGIVVLAVIVVLNRILNGKLQ